MAIGIFVVSILIAVATAIATALSGGGWLAVIGWGIGTAWLSSIALTGFVMLRYFATRSGQKANAPVLVPAGLSHHSV